MGWGTEDGKETRNCDGIARSNPRKKVGFDEGDESQAGDS